MRTIMLDDNAQRSILSTSFLLIMHAAEAKVFFSDD